MNQAPYITIAGPIAVGKSTLTQSLGQRLGLNYILEPYENNPFVGLAHKDPERWSFLSQLYFLTETARSHQAEIQNSPSAVIGERSVHEHFEIFIQLKKEDMSEEEYELLNKLYRTFKLLLRPPELLINLHAPVNTVEENIKARGREAEVELKKEDLLELEKRYKQFIRGWDLSPVLSWDIEKKDLREEDNLEVIVEEIRSHVDLSTIV